MTTERKSHRCDCCPRLIWSNQPTCSVCLELRDLIPWVMEHIDAKKRAKSADPLHPDTESA